ncbi:MAG TPA: polysaccharide deacetylase family protein [Planctomycetota bacterium]|jgi:peptidoglycan/xylan/chitin deacetylase (PgdA/CDA1 family)|nr:polysaccharide deacetylase family protein [Planctomycetota bacterium]
MAAATLKHRLKLVLREVWARLLWHTPLWRITDRLAAPRLVILAGHALAGATSRVAAPSGATSRGAASKGAVGVLSGEMAVEPAFLGRLVAALKRRHAFHTVSGALAALEAAAPGTRRGLVALSFDDGYRDNAAQLPGLLASWEVPATVYLESRPLEADGRRRPNWYHRLAWLERRLGPGAVARRLADLEGMVAVAAHFADGHDAAPGELKRVLKYDEAPGAVEAGLDQLFEAQGGDAGALAAELYMDWSGARALAAAGVELGGHTVSHPVLARLSPRECEREAREGLERIRAEVPGAQVRSFAYPFGRRWDWNADSAAAVARAGFLNAVTTHAGANLRGTEALALKRWALSPETRPHLIAAEACGGFECLRKLGLDLAE